MNGYNHCMGEISVIGPWLVLWHDEIFAPTLVSGSS